MTESRRRAVEIVGNHPGIQPADFARRMWPDSPRWRNMAKCGYGVHRGGGMYLAAGGFLGKLCRAGLLERSSSGNGYSVAWAKPVKRRRG